MKQFTNYMDLYRHILKLFYMGEYKKNERFPTQTELAAYYHVATNSIKKVFRLLLDNGLITTDRSFGTHVLFDHENPAHMALVPLWQPDPDGRDADTLIVPSRYISYLMFHGLGLATPVQKAGYIAMVERILADFAAHPCIAMPQNYLYHEIAQQLDNQYIRSFCCLLQYDYIYLNHKALGDPAVLARVRGLSLDYYRQLWEMMQGCDYNHLITLVGKYYQSLYRIPGLFSFATLDDSYKLFAQESLYGQLLHKLLISIMSSNMRTGQLLPTESELAHEYGISLITVRKAALLLKEIGLIDGERFVGTRLVADWDSPAVQEKMGALLETQKKKIADAIFAEYIIGRSVCDWVATRVPPDVVDTMQAMLDAQWAAFEQHQAPLFMSEVFLTPIINWLGSTLLSRCYYHVHHDLLKFLAIRLMQKSVGFDKSSKVHTYAQRALTALRKGNSKAFLTCVDSAVLLNWELMRTAFDDTIYGRMRSKE